jgi:hypothetical protein
MTVMLAFVRSPHSNGLHAFAGRDVMYKPSQSLLLAFAAIFFNPPARAQPIPAETPQGILAVQVRIQGFSCEKPLGAKLDKRQSRPDHDVWVLKCSNASYRIARVPDMAAKIEPLP